MVLVHLESLVLRGVSVLGDGLAVSLRLGSYETMPQTSKATPFSQRHPSHDCATAMPETNGRPFPSANARGNSAVVWAGRLSRAGVLSRRSPAAHAGRTNVLKRWSDAVGGPQFTAAARLCPEWAKQPAPVGDVFSGRPKTLHDFALVRFQRDERGRQGLPAGITGPATRTLTAASTRGRGF
jgi:hypothetical protein